MVNQRAPNGGLSDRPIREGARAAETAVSIQTRDENGVIRAITPDVVTRFGGTLPFDTQTTQLQDGQTVTDENGDMNIRLNMEAILPYEELQTLNLMRSSGNQLFVVSPSYSGPATFDQFKFDRIPDDNGRVIRNDRNRKTASYTVQLQSKEQSQNSTG